VAICEGQEGEAVMRQLPLTHEQKEELAAVAKRHPKPYMRVKASALLLVHRGIPASVVGRDYLVPSRDADTMYAWMDRYQAGGVAALLIRKGRGRKPAFSPSASNPGSRPRGTA
jgi:hypothetical protein